MRPVPGHCECSLACGHSVNACGAVNRDSTCSAVKVASFPSTSGSHGERPRAGWSTKSRAMGTHEPLHEKRRRDDRDFRILPTKRASKVRTDSPVEGTGFEPSVPL